jgi:2-methylisocitrate lyase-like PEP mutase family enzyme
MRASARLKALLAARRAAILPGTPNALFARVIAAHGFEAVYVTGAGIANMSFGVPDIGLVTLNELTEHVAAIADAPTFHFSRTRIRVLATRSYRADREIARTRGCGGIQIDDQVFPKKCGHFSGKQVIAATEMVGKIRAAVRCPDGPAGADRRAHRRTGDRGIGCGHRPRTGLRGSGCGCDIRRSAARCWRDAAHYCGNPSAAGRQHGVRRLTPPLPQSELATLGFGGVLYANAALQAALKSVGDVMAALRRDGSLNEVADRLAAFEERQQAVDKPRYDGLEQRYR